MDQENTAGRAAPETTEERSDFAVRDLEKFLAEHRGVDVEKLLENKLFLRFCGSRLGEEPLGALYEDFAAFVDEVGAAAQERVKSRGARSTGGGTAGGSLLTPAQKAVLDAWNAEHPEMAMTAREFLGR